MAQSTAATTYIIICVFALPGTLNFVTSRLIRLQFRRMLRVCVGYAHTCAFIRGHGLVELTPMR